MLPLAAEQGGGGCDCKGGGGRGGRSTSSCLLHRPYFSNPLQQDRATTSVCWCLLLPTHKSPFILCPAHSATYLEGMGKTSS